jgi:hypothetical protein
MGFGGGALGNENPVTGFMQGYSFVDNLKRQQEADARARADDELRKQLLQGQGQLLQGQVDAMNNQKQSNLMKAMAADMERDPYGWMNNYDEDTLNNVFTHVKNNPDLAYLATSEGRNRFKTGYNKIMSGMPNEQNGGVFDTQAIMDGLNTALGDQLNKGTDANGRTDFQGKQVAGFVPAPNEGQFYILVKTRDAGGNEHVAPITRNRTGDPDDIARPFTVDEMMGGLRRNAAAVNYLDSMQARLGDQEAIKRISTHDRATKLTDQLERIDRKLPLEEQKREAIKAGLQHGLGVNEAIFLGANWTQTGKERSHSGASRRTAGTTAPETEMSEAQALHRIRKNDTLLAHLKAGGLIDPAIAQQIPQLSALMGKKIDPDSLKKVEDAVNVENQRARTLISPQWGGTRKESQGTPTPSQKQS